MGQARGTVESGAGRAEAVLALLVACAALCVYANTLWNGFAWDDAQIIVGNPATRDLGQLGRVLLSPDEVAPYYRPLNRASYLVDHALFGMRPAAFHAVGVVLHAVNAALLFVLARRLGAARPAALAAGLVFAVHPVTSEAVNFISGRNNLFALLFALLTVIFWVRAVERRHPRRWACMSGLAFFLGLASKEQAVVAAAVIAACAALGVPRRRTLRELVPLAVPHALSFGAYLALRTIALHGAPHGTPQAAPELLARLALNLYSIPRYAALVLFPAGLTNFHEVPARPFALWWIAPLWLAVLALALWAVRRGGAVGRVGLAWLALNVLPIANIVPIPSAPLAERYVYVPFAGLCLVLGAAFAAAGARAGDPRARATAGAVGLAVVVLLAGRTVLRNRDWRDDRALFESAVAADPASAKARLSLAVALKDAGDMAGARREWNAVLARDPANAEALTQVGTLAAIEGDMAAAESLFRRALAAPALAAPALAAPAPPALTHFNLARVLERTGRPGEALREYEAFLAADPSLDREYRPAAEERVRALRGAAPSPR